MTSRGNQQWGRSIWDQSFSRVYYYTNNRIDGYTYDADGRLLAGEETAQYDSAGQMIQVDKVTASHYPHYSGHYSGETTYREDHSETLRYYDGNGREVKRRDKDCAAELIIVTVEPCELEEQAPLYFIRSSVLGNEVLSEVNSTGIKLKTYVRANGTVLAWQIGGYSGQSSTEGLYFEHWDASGMSRRMTLGTSLVNSTDTQAAPVENDPMGGNVGISNPYIEEQCPSVELLVKCK